MTSVNHVDFERRSLVERYVAGRLDTPELEKFERHMLACPECQRAVHLGNVLRQELAASRPPEHSLKLAQRPGARSLALVAIAAVVVALAGAEILRGRAVRDLGGVAAPPPYHGIAVRSSAGSADSLFGEAMTLYGEGRLDTAQRLLREARLRGVDSLPTSFFIGVLQLLSGEPSNAVAELAVVLRLGDSPYLAEAHYYTAKGWLSLGAPDSALAHLQVASATGAPIALSARALADSVRRAER